MIWTVFCDYLAPKLCIKIDLRPSYLPVPDLKNAYHLVRIQEGNERKAIYKYKYLVLPFGLTNAPAVFQNLVNNVLRGMSFTYLDNILIFSKSETDYVKYV